MSDMAGEKSNPNSLKNMTYKGSVRASTQQADDNKARRAHTDELLAGIDSVLNDNEIREPRPV